MEDLADLYDLASFLDSVNLPHDRSAIGALLERSRDTFGGRFDLPGDRLHLLVVEDVETGKVVGASMVIGQLGTPHAPYVFFERRFEERYSRALDRHFRHETLQIRYVYEGPTELGGLIVHPSLRAHPARLGRQIAFARFALIAKWRHLFREECLAELLPPRRPDGGSDFWDAVGRRFTGLDYVAADHLSRVEKEFIRELFPEATIYLSLLSPEARWPVGRVGSDSEPARAMLESIGFHETDRVDPFDGGPHFLARTEEIRPIAEARWTTLRELEERRDGRDWLVHRFVGESPWVLATRLDPRADDRFAHSCRALETDVNSSVLAVPLHNR